MAEFIFTVATFMMLLGLILALSRFAVGPTVVDRVLAFDTLTIISLALIGVIAHLAGRSVYLDVGLVYGLLSFLGVIAVARYLENGL